MRLATQRSILIAIAAFVLVVGAGIYLTRTPPKSPLRRDDEAIVQRGADGLLPAPPHDASGHTWQHPELVLFDVTRNSLQKLAGPDYKTATPAFAGKLSDDDVIAVLSFIKSTWPPKQRQANDSASKTAA